MATPSSCIRCQKPLAVESVSGLCVTCSQALETEQRTATPHIPPSASATAQQTNRGTATRTNDFDVVADTRLWDGKARQRATPSGYDLLRFLGGGGMGDVYLALEYAADRTVAMKFLRAAADPRSTVRFVKEIRALAKLDHPNIIRVVAVDLDRSDPFFTMEYAAGGSLADRVKSDGPMAPEAATELFVRLARAVQAAHSEKILHRDIKPGNIVMADDGTPKLSDFGLAKRMDDDLDTKTLASLAVGTPPYMPPEAVSRRHGDFCEESDVYGLGATLYFTLTGRAPFAGDYNDVMIQVERDEPPRPRSINDGIPQALEAIVLKCLEKKPSNRYATAGALAEDLERHLSDRDNEIIARRYTRRRRATLWLRRRAAWIGAAATVAAAIALSVWIGTGLDSSTTSETTDSHTDGQWIRNDLQRGPVTLIPDAGLPRYYQFPLEAVTLGLSTTGDKTCSYHAFHQGLVELSPPPGINAYRLEFELQHVKARGNGADYLGFYFGYCTAEADGATVHSMFAATFADYLPIANPKLQKEGLAPVLFRRLGWVQNPQGQTLEASIKSNRYGTFTPAQSLPGPWRMFQADISPDEVHIMRVPGPGKAETLVRMSGDDMHREHEELRKKLAGQAPAAAAKLPAWSPDLAFGTISVQAAIAIRNVKIIPRPKNTV